MSAPTEPSGRSRGAGAEDPTSQAAGAAPRVQRDSLPVLAREATVLGRRARELPLPTGSPALLIPMVQAAAAAAGGFVAGAAVAGIVRRGQRRAAPGRPRRVARGVRRPQGGGRSPARAGELVQIVGSRSLLVDVHLLGER
jgi:hypothetical protein